MQTVITITSGNIQIADVLSVIANKFAAGELNVIKAIAEDVRDVQSNEIIGKLIVKP